MSVLYVRLKEKFHWCVRFDDQKPEDWIRADDEGVKLVVDTDSDLSLNPKLNIDNGTWQPITEEEAFERFPAMREFVADYLASNAPPYVPQTTVELIW